MTLLYSCSSSGSSRHCDVVVFCIHVVVAVVVVTVTLLYSCSSSGSSRHRDVVVFT